MLQVCDELHVNRLQMEEFPVVSPSGWKAKTDINITMKHHKGYCFIAFTTVWVMFLIFYYYFILASLLCSRLVGFLFLLWRIWNLSFSPAELPETPLCRMHRARSACQLVVKGRRRGWGERRGNISSLLSCGGQRSIHRMAWGATWTHGPL